MSVHDTTEEGEPLLSLACSAGYYELAQVHVVRKDVFSVKDFLVIDWVPLSEDILTLFPLEFWTADRMLLLRKRMHVNTAASNILQVLVAMRANVEDRGMKGDCTPLMEAASAGHLDIVNLLIAHEADVNAQSSSGMWHRRFS